MISDYSANNGIYVSNRNGDEMGLAMKSLKWEGFDTKICSRTALIHS